MPTVARMTTPQPRDFSRKRKPITFTIDEDVFEAASAIPGAQLMQFAGRYAGIGTAPITEQLNVIIDALSLVLLPESLERFTARLSDLEHPIELEQAAEVVQWLMGEYGMRPTQPSSSSSDGPDSAASGTSSTDEQLMPESIPATFLQTAG